MRHTALTARGFRQICAQKSDCPPLGKLASLIFGQTGCGNMEDVRASGAYLMHLGLTCEEVADLEIREPLASEIIEYARAAGGGLDGVVRAVDAVLSWHIQDIDRQIDMLLRLRRLYERKAKAVSRLAHILSDPDTPRPAI